MKFLNDQKFSRRKFANHAATLSVGGPIATSSFASLAQQPSLRGRISEDEKYHYIVIGSGAGGGPVACRLAERGFRVLILEAGDGKPNLNYSVPAFSNQSVEDPSMSWEFFVGYRENDELDRLNSKYNQDHNGIYYPRAGTLGGCTAHHAMITLYPDNKTWDDLAQIAQDDSYLPFRMKDYFRRLEDCQYLNRLYKSPSELRDAKLLHGDSGWLPTSMVPTSLATRDTSLLKYLFAAAAESKSLTRALFMGELDPNQWEHIVKNKDGLYNTPTSTYFGKRRGTREFILETAAKHSLFVEQHALATKVLFDDNKKAVGVEFLKGASVYKADPRNHQSGSAGVRKEVKLLPGGEVILAGGAFNSPQLLKLSGIGPEAELRQHIGEENIVQVNESVGTNLQDRYEVCVISQTKTPFKAAQECTLGEGLDPCLDEWRQKGQNSLYGQAGVVAGIKKKTGDSQIPDMYIFGLPGVFNGYYKGYSKDVFQGHKHFTWAILKGHTNNFYDEKINRGGGTVKLKSADPRETPEIRFNNFARDPEGKDLRSMREGVRYARMIMNNFAVRNSIDFEYAPGESIDNDEKLNEYIKNEAWGHHASCSNPMGTNPEKSVVDNNFKVHGVQNLRVVDASVFPRIPGLFIVTPIYIMSEKAADVISEDAKTKGLI